MAHHHLDLNSVSTYNISPPVSHLPQSEAHSLSNGVILAQQQLGICWPPQLGAECKIQYKWERVMAKEDMVKAGVEKGQECERMRKRREKWKK